MIANKVSLNVIDVAEPCTVPWDEMSGDAVTRHCSHCKLNVHNLSEMTRGQAERFLAESAGRACVRFYRRADGTVSTADCENAWRRAARRSTANVRRWATALASVVTGVLALGTVSRADNGGIKIPPRQTPPTPPVMIMGIVRMPTSQPVLLPTTAPTTAPTTQPRNASGQK